jgi:hypothetical protein
MVRLDATALVLFDRYLATVFRPVSEVYAT